MPPTARKEAGKQSRARNSAAAVSSLLETEPAVRREDGRTVPLGSRGAATRQRLLDAARAVFEEQGYGQSSVNQISERAGVSQGTFYQYFRDRAHVMAAMVDEYVGSLLGNEQFVWHVRDGREGLARLMSAYVGNYASNAGFAKVWEEVSHIDSGLADVRRKLTLVIEHSMETQLRRAHDAGIIPVLPYPASTARALTSMADRFCYLTYAFDPAHPPLDPKAAAELLTDLWARAICLSAEA